jgi:hypothetical protein
MRMLFGFAVLSMLMTPALSAQPQVKLPAKMIGTWCVGEDAASGGASTIYHRSKDPEGLAAPRSFGSEKCANFFSVERESGGGLAARFRTCWRATRE